MGLGDDTGKQLKKQEIYDRLNELDRMERRLSRNESDTAYLRSFCEDMASLLCFWMGRSVEEGRFNMDEVARWGADIERLPKELQEKEKESEELKHILAVEKAEAEGLQNKLAKQETETEVLREKLKGKEEEAEKWKTELAEERRKVKGLDEELISQRVEAEERDKERSADKTEIQKLREKLAVEKTAAEAEKAEAERLRFMVQNLQAEADEKGKKAEYLARQLKSEQKDAEHLRNEYIKIQNSIKEACAKNEALKQEKDEAEQLLGKRKKELEALKAEAEKLRVKAEESSKEAERLRAVISELREENLAEVNALKQTLSREREYIRKFEDKFGCWKEVTEDYQELLEAVFACDSLAVMIEDYELVKRRGPEDVENLIRFVNLLGDRASFLPVMYDYLEKYKEVNREAVSQAEAELFLRLNSYYRKNYDISGDLIRYPQDGGKFEETQMCDFDNRTKTFRSIECVYVPAVMRNEKSCLKLALVKGVQ